MWIAAEAKEVERAVEAAQMICRAPYVIRFFCFGDKTYCVTTINSLSGYCNLSRRDISYITI